MYLVALWLALAHRAPLPDAVGKRRRTGIVNASIMGRVPSVPLVGLGGAPR
jgi:hypothetical protein